MKKLILFAFFLIFSSLAFAGVDSQCIVTGQVASAVDKKTYFSDGKEKVQHIIFRLKLESAVGTNSSEDQWCSDIFSKQKDKKGNIKIGIYYPSTEIVIPSVGETAAYLWTFYVFEHVSGGSFSPYVEPAQSTESTNPSGV